jgi:hypothetical protein
MNRIGAALPLARLYQPPWGLSHRKQGKAFFFEKKKQKAFVCAVADLAGKVRVSTNKSFFGPFSRKRTACLLRVMVKAGWY